MAATYWTNEDFDVFAIEGLDNRMAALQEKIQPKFHELGDLFAGHLSAFGKGEFFPHVAKHARRTVNPPKDSWVALAPAKRGYKALPHFQIGLWNTHLFIILAVIYENPDKKGISERLQKQPDSILSLPGSFVVSGDHMKPEAASIEAAGKEGVMELLERLHSVKKAELIVGRHISREEAVTLSRKEFFAIAQETIDRLVPLYDLIAG